jgi:hypothetical protein
MSAFLAFLAPWLQAFAIVVALNVVVVAWLLLVAAATGKDVS